MMVHVLGMEEFQGVMIQCNSKLPTQFYSRDFPIILS